MNTKEAKKLLKSIHFPGGKDTCIFYSYEPDLVTLSGFTASWKKYGGYAGKKMSQVREALPGLGFAKMTATANSHSGGGHISSTDVWFDGHRTQVTFYTDYGTVAHDNQFQIRVVFDV